MWELPLPTFLLIHMKLMLFTDFLQTHQSNLHPSDRFPLLNFTKKYLEVMQTPATATGSKQGCEISEKHKSSKNLSEYSTVKTRQRARMWAFEWKVIQHSACHGSQRKTTSSYRLLQHKSCQSLLVFCPVVTSLLKGRGLVSAPPQWGWESESRRFGMWGRGGRGSPLGPDCFTHHALLSGRTSAGLRHILSAHFGRPSSSVSLHKLPKSLWAINYCLSSM